MYQFTDFEDRPIMYQFTDFTDRAKYVSGSQILQIGKNMYQFTDLADKTNYVSVHRFYI